MSEKNEWFDAGPWSVGNNEQDGRVFVQSDDFKHDVRLYVDGDFSSGDERKGYAEQLASALNGAQPGIGSSSAPGDAQAWPPGLLERVKGAEKRIRDGHGLMRVPADPTDPDLVLAEIAALIEGRKPPFWLLPAPADGDALDALRYRTVRKSIADAENGANQVAAASDAIGLTRGSYPTPEQFDAIVDHIAAQQGKGGEA